jgi:hypothetical protein
VSRKLSFFVKNERQIREWTRQRAVNKFQANAQKEISVCVLLIISLTKNPPQMNINDAWILDLR